MVMGKLLGNKNYPSYDYGVAAAIGVGIAVFSVATEDLEIGQDAIGEIENVGGTVCGIVLLLFFLVFDSFTGQYQARLCLRCLLVGRCRRGGGGLREHRGTARRAFRRGDCG